jgi:hypothetical protein
VLGVAGGVQDATCYGHKANYEIELLPRSFSRNERVLIVREKQPKKSHLN